MMSNEANNTHNFNRIWTLLQTEYPNAAPELHFSNTLQILVATILSAQCTDAQVNKVTDVLFKNPKPVEDYLKMQCRFKHLFTMRGGDENIRAIADKNIVGFGL